MGLHLLYKRGLVSVIVLLIGFAAIAQTNISGIINKYAAVTTINFCSNSVVVASTAGFSVGQKVMLIQMKGATVDASNNAAYGNVTSYNGCGNFEINEIDLITGSVIVFKYALQRTYEASGALQLVSLEEYTNAVVNAPLTAQAWDGSTGGVLLLKANTLTLNDSITVKGKGFRGAVYENDVAAQACYNSGVGGSQEYYCATVACGAPKGEGIGNAGFIYGAGKNGNGGGGGDDHNTGGGGGSNYGAGGAGGRRSNTGNFSCPGPLPGAGGQALTYYTANNKVFMGGGGGAGDGNNNEATSGANGGGIVIIMANTLVGNGKKINANGDAVNILARSDGAGGGGAGGSVLLYVDSYTGNVQVNAVGGNGGLLDNGGSNSFCMGPGGGGGGGALWVKTANVPANINLIDTGGRNGMNIFGLAPPACPYGTTNGSQSGAVGGSITNLTITTDTDPFVKLEATACCDTTVCAGAVVNITVTDTATYTPSVIWSTGETTNTISPQVFATTTYTVNVSDNRGCLIVRTVDVTVQNALPNVTLCCDTGVCLGATVQFTTTVSPAGQYTYNWSTGESSPDITKAIVFPRTFTVTVTDVNGCSVAKSVSATVSNAALPLTVCCDTTVCAGSPVTFTATVGGSGQFSYVWSTGETTPSVTKAILGLQQYTITATDANGCSVSGSAQASVNNIPPPLSVCCDTTVCPGTPVNFLATVAAQGTFTYAWSSGKSTAAVTEVILATRPYTVTVTDVNGCSASASAFATANNNGPQLSVCCDTLVCAGSQVNFSASSTVSVTYVWSTGQTTAAITTPVASSTVIYVTATDANGCVGIQGVNANTVNAYTVITAVPDTAINVGQSVELTASGNPAFTYTWSPTTDLSSGSVYNPLASPAATTTYCVTVTDNYGCLASDCIDVNVIQKDIVIKVPDAFAPNGNDAANHVFTIFPIADTRVAEVKIYNRWGEVVFSAQGNAAWDGTFQGKAQPAGAYVCRIIYGSAAEPASKTLTKDFLLIR